MYTPPFPQTPLAGLHCVFCCCILDLWRFWFNSWHFAEYGFDLVAELLEVSLSWRSSDWLIQTQSFEIFSF